jgi:acyl carrier protein
MNEQDKIELMNHIIALARPVSAEELKIDTLDIEMKDTNLDSLDFLMMGVYLGDVYGLSEEDLKNMQPKPPEEGEEPKSFTIRDIFKYVEAHATKTPTTLKEAIANIE